MREIFERALRGNGLKEICKELNSRGMTNRGKRWYKGGLHYPLTNEAYTGTALWGKTAKGVKARDPIRGCLISRRKPFVVSLSNHERRLDPSTGSG